MIWFALAAVAAFILIVTGIAGITFWLILPAEDSQLDVDDDDLAQL